MLQSSPPFLPEDGYHHLESHSQDTEPQAWQCDIGVDNQARTPDVLEHPVKMLHVLLPGSNEDNNVINVGRCIFLCSSQHLIH